MLFQFMAYYPNLGLDDVQRLDCKDYLGAYSAYFRDHVVSGAFATFVRPSQLAASFTAAKLAVSLIDPSRHVGIAAVCRSQSGHGGC